MNKQLQKAKEYVEYAQRHGEDMKIESFIDVHGFVWHGPPCPNTPGVTYERVRIDGERVFFWRSVAGFPT
jgi:hypothetical protein